MISSDWLKIKEVFSQTLDLPEAERAGFLENYDAAIRREVGNLLRFHEQAADFIEQPFVIENSLTHDDYAENLIGKMIGNYKILEKIGEGGMGRVFLAERIERDFSQKVALKIIKRGMDTNAVLKRFLMERQILAALAHPNIARLLDGGSTQDGTPFFVMEYVAGENIRQFCDERHFDIRERLELFRQICAAVAYLHQNLIVHRDLKPSNILVTKDGTPKLLDFGIAKLLNFDDYESTATAAPEGRIFTPEYASPEQLNGSPITTATDVYSLGVILYELLSGVRPFKSNKQSYQEIVNLILTEEPARPSSVLSRPQNTLPNKGQKTKSEWQNRKSQGANRKSLNGDLDNIILKALRKEPERRYHSVQEFAEDIRRFTVGLPVTATADSAFYRFSKFVGRNKIGTMIAAVILVLSGFAVWQSFVAVRERQKSEKRLTEIRNVAKSLMNETNDSLAKIPGNVAVQKALAEKSVALLDSLAAEETDDAALLAELADAYTKLANIQTWSFREFEKAAQNLEKAGQIYLKILRGAPDNLEIRKKIYAAQMRHIETLHDTNRREEMFRVAREAVENRREIIRIEPENPSNYANLAALYGWFGDKNLLFGRDAEAVENYRQGIGIIAQALEKQAAKGDSAESRAELARLNFINAWLTEGAGETEKAIEIYRQTAVVAKNAYAENADLTGNFARVYGSYEKIAGIYEKQGDFAKALENYQTAKKKVEEGLRNENFSERATLTDYLCVYSVYSGKMAEESGDRTLARRFFDEGETACRTNVAQDENDAGNIFESLPFFYKIAEYRRAAGETEKSVSRLRELAQKLETILEKNRSDLTAAFALAETYEKIGDLSENKDEFYEKSVKIWRDYSAQNSLLPDEAEKMNRVVEKLARFRRE